MFTEFQVDESWFTSEWNHLLKETSKIKNFYGYYIIDLYKNINYFLIK
jgi:hypothetical protein